ncbi:MAG: hypothetical protein ACOX6K_08380 [Sphaerochaetaceae bacterium]
MELLTIELWRKREAPDDRFVGWGERFVWRQWKITLKGGMKKLLLCTYVDAIAMPTSEVEVQLIEKSIIIVQINHILFII